jgi:hypothetical protein
MPVGIYEHIIYHCEESSPLEIQSFAFWWTMFGNLHENEKIVTGYLFTPAHWNYTGNQILAEAIFSLIS